MPFNKSTRSYFFRSLVAEHDRVRPMVLTWREARLMFKGATVAAIACVQKPYSHHAWR